MATQNIAFRVDASSQIGTGHFMRCLTLADALKQHGSRVRFVSSHLPEHLRAMLAAKGHEFVLLGGTHNEATLDELAHAHWLGVSQAQDATDSILVLSDETWDWLVVDHYALDSRWESMLRQSAKKILVLDDIADRQHDCDILLDQNLYTDMQTRYNGKVPAHCQLLLGPRYALLRDEFRKLREQIKPRAGEVKRILVFFGGVDADNFTGRAIEALSEIDLDDLHVDVVIGAQHPCREQIKTACEQYGYFCHIQTTKMADLMAAADLAIGAGGSATWERCCLGLPAICFCVAENQRKQIASTAEAGLMYAPSRGKNLACTIRHHVNALLENPSLLKLISNAGMKAMDGKGVIRAISTMEIGSIKIRQVNEHDSPHIFEWRNHQTIRSVSKNTTPITWEDHQRWFDAVMGDKNRKLLVGIIANQPVGVVRFDKEGDVAEVSIYLVPDGGFVGQGRNLLLSAEQWLKVNQPDIKSIRANVLGDNVTSKNLFLSSNYRTHLISYQKALIYSNG